MTCPVCRRTVAPTPKGNLYRHRDKADNPCPASGLPCRLIERW